MDKDKQPLVLDINKNETKTRSVYPRWTQGHRGVINPPLTIKDETGSGSESPPSPPTTLEKAKVPSHVQSVIPDTPPYDTPPYSPIDWSVTKFNPPQPIKQYKMSDLPGMKDASGSGSVPPPPTAHEKAKVSSQSGISNTPPRSEDPIDWSVTKFNPPQPIKQYKMSDLPGMKDASGSGSVPPPPPPPTAHEKAKAKQPRSSVYDAPVELTRISNYQTMKDETESKSGRAGRWSEGNRGILPPGPPPKHRTGHEKAKVLATTSKPKFSCPQPVIPGLWASSISDEYCCIYRVPTRLRRVNPEVYFPQMLLIGPLHHSKKAEALELAKTDLRYLDYMNMELHKKKYLNDIANKYGVQTVQEFKRIIERDEQFIRESYAESTDWIKSQEFVEMILHDSVFILGFILQMGPQINSRQGDILFKEPCLITTILEDLILLENQLPYALLEELFQPFFFKLKSQETFREIILLLFRSEGKIERHVKFRHFTDLLRRVRVETLGLTEEDISRANANPPESIKSLHNADKLDSAGVDFVTVDGENHLSLMINFESGILKMPCFIAEDNTERVLRNIMALEQCHYPHNAYVCNYITFLDFLIDSEQDADLLLKKGVVKNWLGQQGSLVEMMNKLCLGIVDFGSYYYPIAESLNNHYKSRLNRSLAKLRRVYFNDLWTGTATVAAVVLLVLTLIQTVASILQVMPSDDK